MPSTVLGGNFEGSLSQLLGVVQEALWSIMQPRAIGEDLWLSVPNGQEQLQDLQRPVSAK